MTRSFAQLPWSGVLRRASWPRAVVPAFLAAALAAGAPARAAPLDVLPTAAAEGAPAPPPTADRGEAGSPSADRPGERAPEDAPRSDLPPVQLPEAVVRIPAAELTRDPTAAVTVVSAERFGGEAKAVAELVATAPGVAVQQYGGLGQLTTVSIRGAAPRGVLVLLDGLPLNGAMGNAVDLASVPRHWLDRVEILRGPEAAHYGPGAIGGVVNLVTRSGGAGRWSGEATAGSFGTWGASAERAGELGPARAFAAASAEGTGGEFPYRFDPTPDDPTDSPRSLRRANAETWRGGLVLKLGAPVAAGQLDALVQLSAGRRELPGWPYALTPGAWQEDARAIATGRLAAAGPAGIPLAARVSVRGDLLDLDASGTGGSSGEARQRGVGISTEGEARLPHRGGALRATVAAERETLRVLDGESHARVSTAIAVSDDLALGDDRLRLAPAVRLDRVGSHTGLSGKLGAALRLAGPLSLRASGGRSYRVPGFAELVLEQGLVQPNPELRPETGIGADAALVVDLPAVVASAGVHATVYDDLVFYQPVFSGRLKPFNVGRAAVRGLELEAATAPVARLLGLALSGAYTLLDTEVLRGDQSSLGKEIPHRARHRAYARAALGTGALRGWTELHAVSRQYRDAPNRQVIPGSRVWNAGGSIRVARAPAVRLHLTVQNLLDDRTVQDGFGNPLPGRTVLVTLRAGSTEGEVTK